MFGIDVSHHQGTIDWLALSKNKPAVEFILIKATQGTGYTDPQFYNNVNGANNIGLKFGFYHFSTLNSENVEKDASEEAEYFLSVINKTLKPALPLVLDIEVESPNIQLDREQVRTWIKTFFSTLEKTGHKNYMIYSGTPFLNSHLPKGHGLGTIPLWLAAYTNKPEPVIPAGWNDYTIWQYSEKGKINGIAGPCDLNKTKLPLF
jgi:lysozyme